VTEGRLTSYNRKLTGLKAEYIGDDFQVLGFAAETNQGFTKDEIAAEGLSGPYQLSNELIIPQSEEIIVETRDRVRPDVILERKTLVRFSVCLLMRRMGISILMLLLLIMKLRKILSATSLRVAESKRNFWMISYKSAQALHMKTAAL